MQQDLVVDSDQLKGYDTVKNEVNGVKILLQQLPATAMYLLSLTLCYLALLIYLPSQLSDISDHVPSL